MFYQWQRQLFDNLAAAWAERDRRLEAARELHQIRCLPAGSRMTTSLFTAYLRNLHQPRLVHAEPISIEIALHGRAVREDATA